jgi:DNA replication licensing factor MCM2
VSVRKTLQKNFRKYITFGEENNQLLMHQLQGLIRDAEKYQQLLGPTRGTASSIEVYISDLKTKAKELNIHDLTPFFNSSLFRNHGLTVDETRGVVVWVQH